MEILYNGTWGTVCDNAWDINDAEVVCRHLGFTGALDAPRGAHFGSADDMTPIWLEVGPGLSIDFVMHPLFKCHILVPYHCRRWTVLVWNRTWMSVPMMALEGTVALQNTWKMPV